MPRFWLRHNFLQRFVFLGLALYTLTDAIYHTYYGKEVPVPDDRAKCDVDIKFSDKISLQRAQAQQNERKAQVPVEHTSWSSHHTYRKDGIMEVHPDAQNPILELMDRAQKRWNEMLRRQSSSLEEAIEEYQRRYHRNPPKGFDLWWKYVEEHEIQLPDEYDLIYRNIEPFWGVSPWELIELQKEKEKSGDSYTIFNDRWGLQVINPNRVPRADDQLEILKPVRKWLPHFRATMSIHDGPNHVISHEHRMALLDAASTHTYADRSKSPQSYIHGWPANCAHNAPLRDYDTSPSAKYEEPSASPHTFIHDHLASMNPCYHPSHTKLNGFLAAHREGPGSHPKLIPSFAICSTSIHADILTVAPEQWKEDVDGEIPWEQKIDERLLWRGSNTGILFKDGFPWNSSHRVRLVEQTTRRGGLKEVLLPHKGKTAGEGVKVEVGRMNAATMDIAFAGKPIQCGDEKTCQYLEKMFEWRRKQGWEEARIYKYVLDIDGNGWSARFKRLLTSNSLVFKVTIHPEWYTERIVPWLHFVPIQNNLADLYDAFLFFHGDLNGNFGRDDLAKKIALAGREWSKKFWRKEDMTAYMFRLLLEYARVMSVDREAMTMKVP